MSVLDNSNAKIYKHLDEKIINDVNLKLYTWNHEKETIKLIDDVINHYYFNQNWNKFIRENSNTIDIGAHSGDTLIPLILGGTNFFKSKTKILALEPNPYVRECCELNALNNISENVEIIVSPFAITDKDNTDVVLYDHGNDMCNGGIIHDGFTEELKQYLTDTPNKKGVECTGMTLETICNKYFTEEEVKNISFIKIDTEGYDREIINSSKQFLNKYKPVIFMEWFDFYNEKESLKLFEIIKDINYIPFNPITLEMANVKNKIWDLLLIHKDDIENLKKTKILSKNDFGFFFVPNHGTGIAHKIIANGEVWERETIKFVINNCQQKNIVSAGTFIGDFIIPFCKNTKGNVICFEPEPENNHFTKLNIELNNITNVIFSGFALSNENKPGFLKCLGSWVGSSNKYQEDLLGEHLGETAWVTNDNTSLTIPINLITLDYFLEKNSIDEEISIIQLDIEGYEMNALDGSKKTIEKYLPIIISESPFYGDIYDNFLKKLGYELSDKLIGHRYDDGGGCFNYILYIPNKHKLIF